MAKQTLPEKVMMLIIFFINDVKIHEITIPSGNDKRASLHREIFGGL